MEQNRLEKTTAAEKANSWEKEANNCWLRKGDTEDTLTGSKNKSKTGHSKITKENSAKKSMDKT